MIKLISDCFECTDCGVEILIDTKKSEVIKGSTEYTVNCSNCDAKYIIDGSNAYLLPPDLYQKQVKTKLKSNDRINPFYIVFLVIMMIAVVIAGLTILPKKYNNLKSEWATKQVEASTIPTAHVEPNIPASTNITPDKPSNQQELNSIEQLKQDYKYKGKFTLGDDQQWHADNFSLTIDNDQIHYEKDGNIKDLDAINKGIYTRQEDGITFKYQQYYLPSKGTYLLISHTKEIKHNGAFYYRIIIDGQTQLAL